MVTLYNTVAYYHSQDIDISFNYLLTDLIPIPLVFLFSCANVHVYTSLRVCLKFENLHSPDMSGLHAQRNRWMGAYSHRLPLLEWGGLAGLRGQAESFIEECVFIGCLLFSAEC